MSNQRYQLQRPSPDTLAVSGALDFHTAAQVLAEAGPMLVGGDVRVLDLSGVRSADSAGLACVISLQARASRHGPRLEVRGLPGSLARLAAVSDAEGLIG